MIKSITYGSLSGMGSDLMGFDIEVEGGAPAPGEFNLAITSMVEIPHRSRIVRVHVTPDASDLHMESLMRWGKQQGYYLIGVHDGQMSYRWETYLDYLIVHLDSRVWPPFKCNELIYPMALGPEPVLPPAPLPKLMLEVGDAKAVDIWKWLGEARNAWHPLTRKVGGLTRHVFPRG